jgi:hypothetical protein
MTDATSAEPPDDPVYAFKPSLMGAPWLFRLRPHALEWHIGRHEGRTPYGNIARVHLSYRPSTMQMRRFQTEIWTVGGPKLSIASTSWRSVIEQERLEPAYRAFVLELHRRIAAARADTTFRAGSLPLLYWPGIAIVGGATLAITVPLVSAVRHGDWKGVAIILGLFALFAWQGAGFFYRNWPASYRPDAVPPRVLP